MKRLFLKIALTGLVVTSLAGGVAAQSVISNQMLERAESLYQMGKYREAQKVLGVTATVADKGLAYNPIVAMEAQLLDALCQAQLGNGIEALQGFVKDYPDAPQISKARLALGGELFEAQRWAEAVEVFGKVRLADLGDEDTEEYCFRYGYAAHKAGDDRLAREWLRRLDRKDKNYYPHARYLLGYISYNEGLLVDSKLHFGAVAQHDDYKAVVPYYLLNIEFLSGNDEYVSERAQGVLDGLAGERRAEVERIAAQSNFRLERWAQAEEYVALLRSEGVQLGREENYIGGYALYRMGDYDNAAGYLRGACGPNDQLTQNAAYHLADCYLRLGDKKQARQSFSMAYSSGSDKTISEDALYNYCKLLVEQGGGTFDEEIQGLSQYLHEWPRSAHRAEIEGYLVMACYDADDLKGAYAVLKEFSVGGGSKIREAMQKVAYYYAAECYTEGRIAEAEEYCNLSLDLADYDSDIEALAIYLLGEVDYAQGKWASAAAMFDQYIRLGRRHQPEYIFAYYNLGYARFNNGRHSTAYDDFADFVEYRTTNDSFRADAYNRLGDIEAVAKNYTEASKLYARSAAMEGVNERFYGAYRVALMEGLAGNVEGRLDALRGIIAEGRGNYVVRASYELGHTLVGAGRYDEAVEALLNFTTSYPSSPDYVAALSDLGLAYRNVGNDDAALEAYKRVVSRSKGSIAAHNALGEIRNIYVERNEINAYMDYAEGVGMAGEGGDRQRDSLSFVAAQKVYIAGDKQKAAEAFDKYLAENPEGAYTPAALYYSADCRSEVGDRQGAIDQLTRLTSMYYNSYTQRGYEKLAQISVAAADYGSAAEAYKKIVEVAQTPAKRREALEQYLTAVASSGASGQSVVDAADWVLSQDELTPQIVRKAKLQKAKALEAIGKRNPAVAIYNDLGADVSNAEGAESAYKIIETAFQYGSFEKAEALVYEFADKGTPHAYWLAKSFLLLGDVYVSRGDLFQARATYQSVVDGYSGGDDGIVEQAKERIEGLDTNNTTPSEVQQ